MDERRQEEIKKEAKQLLDKFAKVLDKVKDTPEGNVEREEDKRAEGKIGKEEDKEFRKYFFDNMPARKGDCLQAEKGAWK